MIIFGLLLEGRQTDTRDRYADNAIHGWGNIKETVNEEYEINK